MSNTILKKCPFCGNKPIVEEWPIRGYSGEFSIRVFCPNCQATRSSCCVETNNQKTIAEATIEAMNAWNERAYGRKTKTKKNNR